jgi:putative transposase
LHEHGLVTLSKDAWALAKRRAAVIGPIADQESVSSTDARKAAARVGISTRLVYELIARYRAGQRVLTDLAPRTSSGGKGKLRLEPRVEKIIADVIETFYLTRQKRSIASITREVRKRCVERGYAAPARNTIEHRINNLDPKEVVRRRNGYDASKRLKPIVGETPLPSAPLDVVQIDHSPVDVIVVDESSREPIGRPTLTLAIDVFSRCIVGMLLSLEAPSATSVGLCLAHMASRKDAYLLRLGLEDVEWSMYGKPQLIHLDNGPEFHSEALERGCDQYGIRQEFRPKKQPHYGGIIERVIGTAMRMTHELPGTTFSNIQARGQYDSQGNAVLTLQELEKWLVLAIASYHKSVHSSLKTPPENYWRTHIRNRKFWSQG